MKNPHANIKFDLEKRERRYPIVLMKGEETFVYLAIQKNGSSSIRRSVSRMKGRSEVTLYDYHNWSGRPNLVKHADSATWFCVLRHPVARLRSAFQNQFAGKSPYHRYLPRLGFDLFWEHVKENNLFDPHIYPQTLLWKEEFEKYNVNFVRLEDIKSWWPEYHERFPWVFPEEPHYDNASRDEFKISLTDHEEIEILRLYSEDLALWEHAGVK